MKKNKGFTLIELLAVIVILAIIALIAVPVIMNIITNARKSAFKDTAYSIIKSGEIYYADKLLDINGMTEDVTITLPDTTNELDLKGDVPTGSITIKKDGKVSIGVTNGQYCITKGFDDSDITITEDYTNCENPGNPVDSENVVYTDAILNGADPVLKTGMIPVVISANGTVKKADETKEWYNYTNKQWANAVLVTNDTRSTYESMDAGGSIAESDILAYFVWIPRYRYELWYTEATNGMTSFDTSKVHSINIVFENKSTTKSDGTCNGTKEKPTNGCYLTHPAFTFGEEVNGIWVGKFETGYNGATSSSEANVEAVDSSKVIIKPTTTTTNVYSWTNNTVSNMFYTAFNMNSTETLFGLTTNSNTHMMKNTEWGAVTYLTFSDYGKDSEVYLNNHSGALTGCGADAVNASSSTSCLNIYGTKSDDVYNQSTTGNISGIFDMSGGANEYVMGYATAASAYGDSGFTASNFPDAKYVDTYTSTTTVQYSNRILGDATGEMGPFAQGASSWYNDYTLFISGDMPWFMRGGYYGHATGAGIVHFNFSKGGSDYVSFRVVLI